MTSTVLDATLLLCDYADEKDGKLYLMGVGWTNFPANTPRTMAIAGLLFVPWDRANHPFEMDITLVDEDGNEIPEITDSLHIHGKMELGRPPGLKPGVVLNAPFAFVAPGIALDPGSYAWLLKIDGTELRRASFTVS